MDAAVAVAGAVFLGTGLLATWYHRVYLANPPGRLSWIWAGLVTVWLALFAVLEPGPGHFTLVLIAAGLTVGDYYLYRRRRRGEERGADGDVGAAE